MALQLERVPCLIADSFKLICKEAN